jgi:hypothetical protein|tara:strand:- start:34 stop:510 length:477 start_codon:yes stop_codon:yes gene_type:complete
MTLIIETKTSLRKNQNTKTSYLTESVKEKLLTERQYNLTVNKDTLKWFRTLGGSETAQKSYTSYGYVIYKLTSTSPDKEIKNIREFQFYSLDYKEGEIFKNLFKEFKNGLFYLKRFKKGLTIKEVQKVLSSKLEAYNEQQEKKRAERVKLFNLNKKSS